MGLERHSAGVGALKKVGPIIPSALAVRCGNKQRASHRRRWPSWRWLTGRITSTWRSCGRRWAAGSWGNEPLLMGNGTGGTFCYHFTEEKENLYFLFTQAFWMQILSRLQTQHFCCRIALYLVTVFKRKKKKSLNRFDHKEQMFFKQCTCVFVKDRKADFEWKWTR